MKRPQLVVIAGPNGAGKSTVVRRYLVDDVPVVNPDDIAAQIDPIRRDQPIVQAAAGRRAVRERNAHLAAGRSFAIETTLTGHSEQSLIQAAKAAGYKIYLAYVGLDDAGLSEARVAGRVAEGGHAVPPAAIHRRYERSLAHLASVLKMADRAWVFDNSGGRLRLLLSRERGRVKHLSRSLPTWVKEAIPKKCRQRDRANEGGR